MELAALRSMPDASLEVPPEEELEVLNQYLSAGETFIEVEEQRKAALAAQVGGSAGWLGAGWACMGAAEGLWRGSAVDAVDQVPWVTALAMLVGCFDVPSRASRAGETIKLIKAVTVVSGYHSGATQVQR